VVSNDDLAHPRCWEHRIERAGIHSVLILADGRTICTDSLNGALNRLVCAPSGPLRSAHPEDRLYATQEFTALYLSWLYSLPGPILNRPSPQGLCGTWRHHAEWTWLAAQAGLPTIPYSQTSVKITDELDRWHGTSVSPDTLGQMVFVVGNQVVGQSVPLAIMSGCRRLAQLADTALLGIDLTETQEGLWTFSGATPCPDLRPGGELLLDALAHALREEQGVTA
jgi:hypothetical protein